MYLTLLVADRLHGQLLDHDSLVVIEAAIEVHIAAERRKIITA